MCAAVFLPTQKSEPNAREATLVISEDELRARVHYDAETGKFFRKNLKSEMVLAGTFERSGYLVLRFQQKKQGRRDKIYAHRLAFFLTYRRWPKMIDHANGDKTDNRLCNLRECTPSQNSANQRRRVNATGFRGVTYKPKKFPSKPYRASVSHQNQKHELGYFRTPEEAARAYDAAAIRIYGEFARLNFGEAA